MAVQNFPADLAAELGYEGGFTNDPKDPGGATNLGITLGELSHWLGRPATIAEIKALTPLTVEPIYRVSYWNAVRGDDLPAGVDLLVFDEAVNSGPKEAALTLQRAINQLRVAHVSAPLDLDGYVGAQTVAAAKTVASTDLINRFTQLHETFYRSLPTFAHFGHGWLSRLYAVAQRATDLAKASPSVAAPIATTEVVRNTPFHPYVPETFKAMTEPYVAPAVAIERAPPTQTPVVTPARVAYSVAGAGLLAGATAITQSHVADLRGLVDLLFVYAVGPVVLGAVAGLFAQIAQMLHINTQNVLMQRVLTVAENGAALALSRVQGAADAKVADVDVKNAAVATALNYVNRSAPEALNKLGLTSLSGQAHLADVVEAQIQKLSVGATA